MNVSHANIVRSLLFSVFLFNLPINTMAMSPGDPDFGSPFVTISNPDWFINMTDFGYSDIAADVETGANAPLYFREYLSGEWGAALSYSGGGDSEWFEPNFVFPDWLTNSTYMATTPIGAPVPDPSGFPVFSSTIENSHFSVTQTYQFLDTVGGIQMGNHPVTGVGPGASITSNRYVLRQTYSVTNKTDQPIEDVQLYQFLHGLNSTRAVFDDRDYGETTMCGAAACSDYHYDTTLTGTVRAFVDDDKAFDDLDRAIPVNNLFSILNDIVPGGVDDAFFESLLGLTPVEIQAAIDSVLPAMTVFDLSPETLGAIAAAEFYNVNFDTIGFHSDDAPVLLGWEVGEYGVDGVDNHVLGKPATGVHLSVESGSLSGADLFDPEMLWVSGAQQYALGTLAPNGNPEDTAFFDVLLSISTEQSVTVVPVPAGLPLLASAMLALFAGARRGKSKLI